MAIHDWSRVEAGIFHNFHQAWITTLTMSLNAGLLPDAYYALAEQFAGRAIPDVVTLQGVGDETSTGEPQSNGGAVALAESPPRVWFQSETEADVYAAMANHVAIRHVSDHRVVAIIELVSPGNKDRRSSLRDFVEKSVSMLAEGIHLLVIDLFPPGRVDPQGIHKAFWDEIDERDFALPADRPLTLAAYVGGVRKRAYVEPVAVGETLPEMPLFLTPDFYVPTPLEATYASAFNAVPIYWRRKLQTPGA